MSAELGLCWIVGELHLGLVLERFAWPEAWK